MKKFSLTNIKTSSSEKTQRSDRSGGFSLVELMVAIGIFAMMTTVLITKYGTFNQEVLLNNLAYDVAITIRNAQSYGLNVKSAGRNNNEFTTPFGVHFAKGVSDFTFFADANSNGSFDTGAGGGPNAELVTLTKIKKGSKVDTLCAGTGPGPSTCQSVEWLDVTFRRPDPNAIIKTSASQTGNSYAEIKVMASDGSAKKITVRANGQIAVSN